MQNCITASLNRCHDMGSETKQLYIVLSQTGTMLSRILKVVTGAEYNHASISLSADLEQMYSFGRRHPYNPFWGGFVQESPHTGTFKRFQNTTVVVLAVEISEERYNEIRKMLNEMYLQKENYHYNYLGLFLAAVHIQRKRKNCYYCSEFAVYILSKAEIIGIERLNPIVQPIHFLDLPHRKLFCGKLSEFQISANV